MATGGTTNFKVIQPVVTNISYYQSWSYTTNGKANRLVALPNRQTMCATCLTTIMSIDGTTLHDKYSPGAKMGTWKCLRVQGFMIDPDSVGVLKEIKLGCHDGNLGELFLCA